MSSKRKGLLVLWTVVSLLGLLACSVFGIGDTESPPAMDESAVEEDLPQVDVPAEAPSSEEENAADEVNAAVEEEAESEDEEASTPEEDEATENDESPSQEELVDIGPTWGASNTPAQSACDNPYMPIRPGSTWTMQDTEGPDSVWTITDVTGDMDYAEATMVIATEGITLTYNWECRTGGSMTSFDYAGITADFAEVEMIMMLEEGGGE